MELVGTRSSDDVDLGPGGATEFRAVAVAVDLELVDRIDGGEYQDGPVRAHVVVVGPVHHPEVAAQPAAAHGQLDARHEPSVFRVETIALADTGHQRPELQEIATVERELSDLLPRHEARHFAANGLNGHRRALDRDRLGECARDELHVLAADIGNVEDDAGAHHRLEPGEEYDPDPFVIVERLKPVFSFLTVTVAPGTTAPVLSVTVPRRLAVILWAEDGAANATRRIVREIILRIGRCLTSFGNEFAK